MKQKEILPNGAAVVDKAFRNGAWTYLCYWEGQYMPWVTWQATDFAPKATFCGHYFIEEANAREDFNKRVNPI